MKMTSKQRKKLISIFAAECRAAMVGDMKEAAHYLGLRAWWVDHYNLDERRVDEMCRTYTRRRPVPMRGAL